MNGLELNEQEIIRRQSLDELRKLGIDPYPAAQFPVSHLSSDIISNFEKMCEDKAEVIVAGRIMARRIMGSASFFELQDEKGKIQIYVKRDDICPDEDKTLYNTVFKRLLDIGDIVGVKGFVFRTQMGEESVHAQELKLLSKSIKPLPIVKEKDGQVFDAFSDPEQRYRQRYVDRLPWIRSSVPESGGWQASACGFNLRPVSCRGGGRRTGISAGVPARAHRRDVSSGPCGNIPAPDPAGGLPPKRLR